MNRNDLPSTSIFKKATTPNPGTTFVTFAATPCTFARVHNPNSVTVDVQRDGAGEVVTIPAYGQKTFYGVDNLSKLGVRRTDQSNTQVDVQGEALN
jgi:hypothetical protein